MLQCGECNYYMKADYLDSCKREDMKCFRVATDIRGPWYDSYATGLVPEVEFDRDEGIQQEAVND